MEFSLEIIKSLSSSEYLENRQEIRLFLKPLRDIKIQEEKLERHALLLQKKLETFQKNIENERKIKDYRTNYYLKNKEKIRKYHKELYLHKKKIKDDRILKNRILNNLRSRLSHSLKRNSKIKHSLDYIGCTIQELKFYIEKQFTNGMSWDNYGKWHIDHIRPCASFDLSNHDEQCKCFHFSNLQPLWEKDNLSKNDSYKNP
jgi:hypothetical protein